MKRIKIWFSATWLLIVTVTFPQQFSKATTTATGPIYWGTYADGGHYGLGDAPWTTQTLDIFEAHAQKKISILHWGQPWWNCNASRTNCGYQYFDVQKVEYDKMRSRGVISLVDWASWDLTVQDPVYDQPKFALRTIINGDHDAYIRTWAQQAKAWGHPFFLRFNWEMNGTWYPWSEKRNGNQPGEYAQAWRHVRDIFKQVGANNVTWVWCVNNLYTGSIPIEGLYPGDAYVDWTCVDGYNRGTNPLKNDSWKSPFTVFSQTYNALVALAPSKPIMIGETASTEYGGSKATWIRDLFTNALPNSFPQIKAVLWFNWNNGGMDWVIESSAEAQQAFAESIASPYYAQNEFANLDAAPIPPRDQLFASSTPTPLAETATPTAISSPGTPLPPTVTSTPHQGTVRTFPSVADAYVVEVYPTTNYGTDTFLRVENSPMVRSYLRFTVSGLNGSVIQSAILRVYANDSNPVGFAAHPVEDNTWTETGLTYNNAPSFGNAIGTSPPVVAGAWMEVDVSSFVRAEGTYNLALDIDSPTNTRLAARETDGRAPQLVITLAGPVESTPTLPPTATVTPILPTATATPPPASTDTPLPPTETPTPPPTATDTPVPPTATATLRPTATATMTLPPTATNTPVPPTATETLPPTPTASATLRPTATATVTLPPTATNTPVTPTATATLRPTTTNTPVPPTATATPRPTATNTPVPPTATATLRPTATSTPGQGTVLTFPSAADAYVVKTNPNTNYGTDTILHVDNSPTTRSYLRFTVSGLNSARIQSAILRVYANDSNPVGFAVHPVGNNTWIETGLTFKNAPAIGATIGTSPPVVAGSWMEVDVSSFVRAEGTYSLALDIASKNDTRLVARETAGRAPQLVITLAGSVGSALILPSAAGDAVTQTHKINFIQTDGVPNAIAEMALPEKLTAAELNSSPTYFANSMRSSQLQCCSASCWQAEGVVS